MPTLHAAPPEPTLTMPGEVARLAFADEAHEILEERILPALKGLGVHVQADDPADQARFEPQHDNAPTWVIAGHHRDEAGFLRITLKRDTYYQAVPVSMEPVDVDPYNVTLTVW